MVSHITQEFLDMIKLPGREGKRLNYLIVMPRIVKQADVLYSIPYGICMVSSAIKASGRNVYTLNLNYKQEVVTPLRQAILDNNIDVVATGGLSAQYDIIREVLDTAKRIKPEIITIAGGGIVTAEPLIAMEALETADYGIFGEGEITINALAYALENDEDASCIEGVVVKNVDYSTHSLMHRPEIMNLDCLPFPDYDGFEYYMLMQDNMIEFTSLQKKPVLIAAGRSCPFNCTFCFHSSGKRYRQRSIENVFEELDWIMGKYAIESVSFVDELLAADKNYLKALTEGAKKRGLKYWAQMRVDMVTRESIQWLKDSGCYQLSFGVESADNRVLKSMQKKITVEQITQAFEWCVEAELPAFGNLIFGDVSETAETIENSVTWWRDHPEFDINLIWIHTYPGSQLYRIACERGLITDRVKYLREGNWQLNLSKLTDDEYWAMVEKIELFQVLIQDNKNLEFRDIDLIRERLDTRLQDMAKEHKILIWPLTSINASMLNYVSGSFMNHPNVGLANVWPHSTIIMDAVRLFNKRVYTPEDAFANSAFDTVLFAFGNRKSSEYIYNQICSTVKQAYPSVKQVVRLSELLD